MPLFSRLPTQGRSVFQLASHWVLICTAAALGGCATKPELETVRQIPQLMEAFEVKGLAVAAVAADKIIVADGFGTLANGDPYTSVSSCGLYSATKVLASLTYAKLVHDGHIDLNAPLGQYLSDAPEPWRPIPFFRLLNHTSGITMAVNKSEFGAIASNPEAGNEDIYRLVKAAPLDYQPGQYSRYRQSGYAIGEHIVSERLGVDFDTLIAQYVTKPAGMVATVHSARGDKSQPPLIVSAGGYKTTAEDMARLFLSINSGAVVDSTYWIGLLLEETYVFDDYSLGSVIETRDGIRTIGHSGGGARANIRYAPDHKVGVMVCTDDTNNNWLAISLARMLIQEITSGNTPKTPIMVVLADFEARSGNELVAAYRKATGQEDRYDTSDSEALLNNIGYSFLAKDQVLDAIDVFTLNTELFPKSPNTYDSLGEALLAAGNTEAALIQYQNVLALDPNNAHARQMIQTIQTTSNR